ncbi:MAG TPA: 5'/3'-nucleotidase SurE [Acidimicrobiia bacterium]|nr:5'/3'-nucleotidase SurE [Acidimicrobiia bacterium]
MRILATNDDGIEAEGLHALARAVVDAGHDVVVAAPDTDASGSGAAIGIFHSDSRIDVKQVRLPSCDAPAWAVGGPPGLCALAARLGAFGDPPDIVVSGINAGLNTGRAILHSGTVGAALTAQNFGAKGLAVSVAAGDEWRWDTAATIAVEVLDVLIDAPPRSVLNLNVPALARGDVKGVRWARLAAFGAVRAAIATAESDGQLQIELRAVDEQLPPDTDTALADAGYATLTTICGIAEAWPPEGASPAVDERPVPGASFDTVHTVPDASESRNLHSRERA